MEHCDDGIDSCDYILLRGREATYSNARVLGDSLLDGLHGFWEIFADLGLETGLRMLKLGFV